MVNWEIKPILRKISQLLEVLTKQGNKALWICKAIGMGLFYRPVYSEGKLMNCV